MLALAQLNNNQKPQKTQHSTDKTDKESPLERRTYRFIQIRSGSFRSRSKEIRIRRDIEDYNFSHYEFRRPSLDDQTCAQFKVA